MWEFQCDCGAIVTKRANTVIRGDTRSCGCLNRDMLKLRDQKTHGMTSTKTYAAWRAMWARCTKPNHREWARYGGRGIVVCDRWSNFNHFFADMGECPVDLSLDRIDNAGNYEPRNCRWATARQQAENRRSTRDLTHDGRTQSIAAWARETGLTHTCIWYRLKRGWTVADSLRV